MSLISVIIVNFNAKDVLRNCLASLPSSAPMHQMETLVVDNASHDGSVEMARSEFPWATVIANERNLGFSAANNQALQRARGDYLLLLNCDTIVHDDALGHLGDRAPDPVDVQAANDATTMFSTRAEGRITSGATANRAITAR